MKEHAENACLQRCHLVNEGAQTTTNEQLKVKGLEGMTERSVWQRVCK